MVSNSNRDEVDTSAAEAFEKFLVPTIFGPWSESMVDLAGTKKGVRLLDVGCGSGAAARYARKIIGNEGSVSAIDFNAGMIAYAKTLDQQNEIEWHRGDVINMPYKDDAFDIVVGNQLIQFLSEKGKALAEIKRVLAKGGRLALTA
ncbi:MAG: class I SAM-dependent methyltransferase [Pseudomonadota bacterium]|nr:class I SAM-dependent methyltransferase [Pseudomonadota bacterium]